MLRDLTLKQYKGVIDAGQRPTSEIARQYDSLTCSEVAAIVIGSENGEYGRRNILLRRLGQLNGSGNEILDTISVSHRAYDLPCYVLLSSNRRMEGIQSKEFVNTQEHEGTKLHLPYYIHGICSSARISLAVFCNHAG